MTDTTKPLGRAEVAALRVLMGLSLDQMAEALHVNPRTVRSWESGRDRMSLSSTRAVWELKRAHDLLVADYADGSPVIPYDPDGKPRQWFLAALGRAMDDGDDAQLGAVYDVDGVVAEVEGAV